MSQTALTQTTDGYPLDDALRQRLVEVYGNCSPSEKHIIQFLALLYAPVTRVAILQALIDLDIGDDQGHLFKTTSLSVYINRLLQRELLIQERTQGPRCHPLLREIAVFDTQAEGSFDPIVEVIQEHWPIRLWRGQDCRNYQTPFEFVRDVRIAVYQQDYDLIRDCERDFQLSYRGYDVVSAAEIIHEICLNPWEPDWIAGWHEERLQAFCLHNLLNTALQQCQPANEAFELLQSLCEDRLSDERTPGFTALVGLYVEQLLLRGDLPTAKQAMQWLGPDRTERMGVFEGWVFLLEGQREASLAAYRAALKEDLRKRNKRKGFFPGLCGSLFILALFQEGSVQALQEARSYLGPMSELGEHWLSSLYQPLHTWVRVQQGDLLAKAQLRRDLPQLLPFQHPLGTLLHCHCLYWVQPGAKQTLQPVLEPLCKALQGATLDDPLRLRQ